jgi:hypothetical protein
MRRTISCLLMHYMLHTDDLKSSPWNSNLSSVVMPGNYRRGADCDLQRKTASAPALAPVYAQACVAAARAKSAGTSGVGCRRLRHIVRPAAVSSGVDGLVASGYSLHRRPLCSQSPPSAASNRRPPPHPIAAALLRSLSSVIAVG